MVLANGYLDKLEWMKWQNVQQERNFFEENNGKLTLEERI